LSNPKRQYATETSSPNQDKAIAAFQALNQTIEANASKVISGNVASKPAQQSTTTTYKQKRLSQSSDRWQRE
jgi:hypothetical protein